MRTYLLLNEVKGFVEGALDSLSKQKRDYSYEEIVELEEKTGKKYHDCYRKKMSKPGANLEGRKITSYYSNYITANYLKVIMEVTGAKNTSEIDRNIDVEALSVKVLEATDKLGYQEYLKRKNNR